MSMNIAVMWSTGLEKKPWIWPAWRSIVSTRSAPAASSARATRRAEIGSRGARLLVLARVAVPRRDGDHAVRRGADRRVDHQQQLHQRVVRGDAGRRVAARRLDDEHVRPADRLLVAAVDLAVGERLERRRRRASTPSLSAISAGQLGVRAAGEQHQPLVVLQRERRARWPMPVRGPARSLRGGVYDARPTASARHSRFRLALRVALDVRLARAGDPERAGRARRR